MTAALLLASGLSERFGAEDKLLASLGGRPVVDWSLDALRGTGINLVHAVVDQTNTDLYAHLRARGVGLITNDRPSVGQGYSLRLGVEHALAHNVQRLLVMLADMPFVSKGHLNRLLDHRAVGIASLVDGRAMPPFVMEHTQFAAFLASPVGGGRSVLRSIDGLQTCVLDEKEAFDIDTARDLKIAEEWVRGDRW